MPPFWGRRSVPGQPAYAQARHGQPAELTVASFPLGAPPAAGPPLPLPARGTRSRHPMSGSQTGRWGILLRASRQKAVLSLFPCSPGVPCASQSLAPLGGSRTLPSLPLAAHTSAAAGGRAGLAPAAVCLVLAEDGSTSPPKQSYHLPHATNSRPGSSSH